MIVWIYVLIMFYNVKTFHQQVSMDCLKHSSTSASIGERKLAPITCMFCIRLSLNDLNQFQLSYKSSPGIQHRVNIRTS